MSDFISIITKIQSFAINNAYVSTFFILILGCVIFNTLLFLILYMLCDHTTYDYNNKHVIITGGSSGIGLEMAYIYLKLGSKVTIVARNEKKLIIEKQKLIKLLPQSVNKLMAISIDISTNEKTVKTKLKTAIDTFGNCDVLVNCAGTSVAAGFDELKESDFQYMLDVNLLG